MFYPLNSSPLKMAGRPAGRPSCLRGMRQKHSQTDPTKGLGGVSGARQLNAISLLFILVMISLTQPRQALCAQLSALSAQGAHARRHQDEPPIVLCSGASAFDYCSACYHRSARDTEDTIACKNELPLNRLQRRPQGHAGPNARRSEAQHDEKRPLLFLGIATLSRVDRLRTWALLGDSSSSASATIHPTRTPATVKAIPWFQVGALCVPCFSSMALCVHTLRQDFVLTALRGGYA